MSVEAPVLSRFEGPLDLLLDLINRRALDITTVSLAAVAQQYLELVSSLANEDLERLAGYLVIASRLLLIKSQALLPRPPAEDEEEDTGADLVRQLEEYRRYKAVAQHLRQIEESRTRAFPRPGAAPVVARLAAGAGRPNDLVAAFARALTIAPANPPHALVAGPRFRVSDKVRELAAMLDTAEEVDFTTLAEQASCRAEVVALFLALLEMLRRRRAICWQDRLFGRISLAKPGDEEAGAGDAEGGAEGVDADIDDIAISVADEDLVDLIAGGVDDGDNPGD